MLAWRRWTSLVIGLATPVAVPAAPVSLPVLHVQVVLDRLGFSPGVIDGAKGQSYRAALKGFQEANRLPVTGALDQRTLAALQRYASIQGTRIVTLGASDLRGPFSGRIPDDPEAQAKLPVLGYANIVEAMAERFHTTPATIVALNPGNPQLRPGTKLRVPNAVPPSREYPAKLTDDWRATLSSLNVVSETREAKQIVVDKSDGVLRVIDEDGKLIAQFPATMGSEHDPLPIGSWKIQGASYNPKFHYNPKLFWDADAGDTKQLLPPGPNGPVGVIWLDLSKPHYGIHGTPHPETIGRAESHGCIRLTNWDAARLSLMVKPGTPAIFRE